MPAINHLLKVGEMDYYTNYDFSFNNFTLDDCKKLYSEETDGLFKQSINFCKVTFDSILCWPPTPADFNATLRCFSELFDVLYDDTKNVTRQCLSNGTWAKVNYSVCEIYELHYGTPKETMIYLAGYFLSLVTLLVALCIITVFKELHCLRNTIHKNLMWSYILTYSTWISILLLINYGNSLPAVCNCIVTIFHYFYTTTFFWMFVEGLSLYILVVETLTRENFRLRVYVCIGWGIPAVTMVLWAIVKSFVTINVPDSMCSWLDDSPVDWIYQISQLIVLLANVVFLLRIMWVLITKLRSTNHADAQQYHKAAKALLVLIPLLGITYVITIYAPPMEIEGVINIVECIRAVLISTQGLTVAIFYCFLNAEVQKAIHQHYDNWKTRRSLQRSHVHSGYSIKDRWLRTRTSSMRRHTEWTLVNTEDLEAQANQVRANGHAPNSPKI